MTVFVIFLKLSEQLVSADDIITHFIVLIVLALYHLEGEVLLSRLIVTGKIKVQPACCDGKSRHTVDYLEGSLHRNLIFIELLLP